MSEPTPADPSITDGASSNGGGLSKLNNAPAPPPSASYPSPHFFHAPSDLPSGSSYSYPPPLMQSQQASTMQHAINSSAGSQASSNPVNLPPIQATDGRPQPQQLQQIQGQMSLGSPLPMNMPPPSMGTFYLATPGSAPNPDGYPLVGDANRTLSGGRNKKEVKRRTKTGCLTCRKRRIKV